MGTGLILVTLLYFLYDDSLLISTLSSHQTVRIGRVIPEVNDTRYKANQEFQWVTLRGERIIGWGDGVFTGMKSKARVELDAGSAITMDENSLIIFSPNQQELTLDLRFGSLKGQLTGQNLKIQVDGRTLDLSGQNAVIELAKRNGQELDLQIVSGEVNLGQKRMVAGEQVRLNKAGAMAVPKPTPTPKPQPTPTPPPTPTPAPPVDASLQWITPDQKEHLIPRDLEGRLGAPARVEFSWKNPNQAEVAERLGDTTYEIQIAKDPEFTALVSEQTSPEPKAQFDFAAEGQYYARVRPKLTPELEKEKNITAGWSPLLRTQVKFAPNRGLPAPNLEETQTRLNGLTDKTAELSWSSVKGAKQYEIEWASDAEFKHRLESKKIDSTSFQFQPKQSGDAFYRVRALTPGGKAGTYSRVGQVSVDLPRPGLKPIESISTLGQTPTDPPAQAELKMAWSGSAVAEGYEVQVSSSKDFSAPITFNTRNTQGALKVNKPGDYYVRVRSLNALSEPLTEFSTPEKFTYTYKVPLATPTLKEPTHAVTLFFQNSVPTFWLGWAPVKLAQTYRLQVASDSTFKNIILETKTDAPRFLVKRELPQGTVYWRARAENTERESHWSQIRSIRIFTSRQASPGNGSAE